MTGEPLSTFQLRQKGSAMSVNPYFLSAGKHETPTEGRCAMEWVAYIAGEPHTDEPVCVDNYLRNVCIEFNDSWSEEDRQRLRPYLARCIGTRGDGLERARRRLASEALASKPAHHRDCGDGDCDDERCLYDQFSVDEALALLDRMLPKVTIDLPECVAAKAREVCEVV